jgi:hypothetical protein
MQTILLVNIDDEDRVKGARRTTVVSLMTIVAIRDGLRIGQHWYLTHAASDVHCTGKKP